MTPGTERNLEREIARSLVGALEVALAPGGSTAQLRAARDAAQVLELPGLDRLIAALGPHAARPWPVEVQPVVERLQRVCARAAAGGLAEFRQADADFNGLAGEIVAMEWTQLPTRGGEEGPSVPTLGAAEMLADLSLAGESSAAVARRVRLTMPVAAAVRAALDWLAGHEGVRAPIELRQDASALEILCEMRDPAGVPAAHQVLSNVDGNLGPPLVPMGAGREGSWLIRVPSFSVRPAYVMIMQGTLRLAVPWHAVLRIQVTPREAIHARAARAGMTVLPRLSSLATRGGECPVVIVGHGLKRAWMVADRLVWRLPAELCDPDSRLAEAGLLRAVETDDGEVFGLVEPRQMLASAPLPALPRASNAGHAGQAGHAAPRAPEILDEASVTPLPAIVAEAAPAQAAAEATEYVAQAAPDVEAAPAVAAAPASDHEEIEPSAAHTEAGPGHGAEPSVEPESSAEPAPSVEPASSAEPERSAEDSVAPATRAGRERAASAAPAAPVPAPPPPAARRALVADDSITARIFLVRLLEQQGFDVVGVERASELHAALAGGPWSLVLVDVELPDARGAALLRSVRARLPEETPIAALARDEHDFTAARHAGVWRTLLKPVEPGALRRLLARLGLMQRASG